MIGGSGLRIGPWMLLALIALAGAPAAPHGSPSGPGVTRSERDATPAIMLAQRCFTYKGQFKCI